jgi:hypothetical protein
MQVVSHDVASFPAMEDIEADAIAGTGGGCLTVKNPLFIGPATKEAT